MNLRYLVLTQLVASLFFLGCSNDGATQSERQEDKEPFRSENQPANPDAGENGDGNAEPPLDVEALRKQFAYAKPKELGEPEIKLTLDEFAKDSTTNLEKYKGKCIEVTAKIVNFGGMDQSIQNRNPLSTFFLIQCMSDDSDYGMFWFYDGQPWLSCTFGDTVTIRGICHDSLGDGVIMNHCELLDSPGQPVPFLTMEVYQEAVGSGEEVLLPAFEGKAFRVAGEIIEAKEKGFNDGIVKLKSEEGFEITLLVEWFDWQYVKAGDKITAICLGADLYIEEGQLFMSGLPTRIDIFE